MSWTRLALSNPTATLVAVLLVVLFGALSLSRLPIQLTPEVERPEITIRTAWRAAAPEEVEAEIVEPQEKVLRGLSGVSRIVSKAQRGQGEVSIEFVVGHDLRRGLIEVLNRLNRVPRYPEDANEPVIDTVGGNSRAIAWFITRTGEGNARDNPELQGLCGGGRADPVRARARGGALRGLRRARARGPHHLRSLQGVGTRHRAAGRGPPRRFQRGHFGRGRERRQAPLHPAFHRRVRRRRARGDGPRMARRAAGAAARRRGHRGRARRSQELRPRQGGCARSR